MVRMMKEPVRSMNAVLLPRGIAPRPVAKITTYLNKTMKKGMKGGNGGIPHSRVA